MANMVDSDFTHDFIIENEAGVAQNVSTWTFEVKVLNNEKLIYTLTDAITFNGGGTDGDCRLSFTAAQMLVIGPGTARLVIRRTDGSNRVVIAEGSLPIQSDEFDA